MERGDLKSRKTIIILVHASVLIASFIFTLPVIIFTVNGVVQPGDLVWEMNDNGEKVAVMRDKGDNKPEMFVREWDERFKKFYDKLGLPIRPVGPSIFLLGIILGAIYILLVERVSTDEFKFVDKAISGALKAHLVMWLLCILVIVLHLLFSGYPEYLRNAIADKGLAEAAVSHYYSNSIANCFAPLLFFVVFDFLSYIIYICADFFIPYRFRRA